MADYYNKTRGPLAVTLSGGRVLMIPAKQWVVVAPEDEGSESLAAHLAHGDLHRSTVNSASAPVPEIAPAPAPLAPPFLAPRLPVTAPPVEETVEVTAENPSESSPDVVAEKRPEALHRRRRE